jgi:hypothetical protein
MQTLFTTLDHLVSRVPLLSHVVDNVVTKVVPQQTAGACGRDYYTCGSTCGSRGFRRLLLCTVGCGCSALSCDC